MREQPANRGPREAEAGFSLIELMVAIVITVIVTGSIFGLLASGQSAFKVQPEHTDRQQNIRTSMDLIMRDVAGAGVGMPNWVQTFTVGLDGAGPQGPFGQNTDHIEMLSNTSGFENEPVCNAPGTANASLVKLTRGTTAFPDGVMGMIIFADGTWTMRYMIDLDCNSKGGDGACTAGDSHCAINVNSGKGDTSGMNTAGGVCQPSALGQGNAGIPDGNIDPNCPGKGVDVCCTVVSVGFGSVIRYEVVNTVENMAGGQTLNVPVLQRTLNGQRQVVARGIEDLQVQYVTVDGPDLDALPDVFDDAPAVVANTYTSLITEVRVTLSSRAVTPGALAGVATTTATGGAGALRASLTSQASPRQALWILTQEPIPAPRWN